MSITMEILAPAGGPEQLRAAVRCGADAVYLGVQGFNARRNAENFDDASLRDAVAYCHGRGVRVYVTLNTLITDAEVPSFIAQARVLADCGVDAAIVQDLGVAELLRTLCPSLHLHASTQMTIHNLAGVRQLESLGFTRAVLARELSAQEIALIARNTQMELEVFVHGALCMSVSGQCMLSSIIGERSGNRGLCAQPCRLNFQSRSRPYALSLKDLSLIPHLQELRDIGVHSLKIEGRMKRPEYVAAAVTACRQALDGQTPDMDTLQAVFSRSGFTDGYFTGKRNLSMFGHRRKEDVTAAPAVLGPLAALYRHERACIPVDMQLCLHQGRPASLTVDDGQYACSVSGDMPQSAQTRPTDTALARRSLEKTGGTPFFLRKLDCTIQPGLMLPASSLNALRKQALDLLLQKRSAPVAHPFSNQPLPAPPIYPKRMHPPVLRVRIESAEQLTEALLQAAERVIVPIAVLCEQPDVFARCADKLVGELPLLVFPGEEEALSAQLARLQSQGLKAVSVGNLGALYLARSLGFTLYGNHAFHILNTHALRVLRRLGVCDATLSFEMNLRQAAQLHDAQPCGILGYGYLPLMAMRNCPCKTPGGCGPCDGRPHLVDRTHRRFPVLCQGKQYSVLLNSVPLVLSDKTIRGMDFMTLYFTIESPEQCDAVLHAYQTHAVPQQPRTGGLYFRELK